MNIDDELRRLFADERLDLAIRPDAEQRIVAGARRLRRRRYVAATACAVVTAVLIGGGIALAGTGGQQSLPPAVSTTEPVPTASSAPPSTTTPPTTTRPPAGTTGPASPTGTIEDAKIADTTTSETATGGPVYHFDKMDSWSYGPLELQMSGTDARATGLLGAVLLADERCATYEATYGGNVVVSKRYGVVAIRVSRPVSDPEGIHVGSTVAEVKAMYPQAVEDRNGLHRAGPPVTTRYFVAGSKAGYEEPWPADALVDRIAIELTTTDCANAF
jgi:hypothetical protein